MSENSENNQIEPATVKKTKRSKVTVEPIQDVIVIETPVATTLEPVKTESPNVTIKIKVGSVMFEQGTFQNGETVVVDRERLKRFPKNIYEIME